MHCRNTYFALAVAGDNALSKYLLSCGMPGLFDAGVITLMACVENERRIGAALGMVSFQV